MPSSLQVFAGMAPSGHQNVFCPDIPQMANSYAVSYLEASFLIASSYLYVPNTFICISIAPHVSLFPPLVKIMRDPRISVRSKEDQLFTSPCITTGRKKDGSPMDPTSLPAPSLIISPLPSCLRPSEIISLTHSHTHTHTHTRTHRPSLKQVLIIMGFYRQWCNRNLSLFFSIAFIIFIIIWHTDAFFTYLFFFNQSISLLQNVSSVTAGNVVCFIHSSIPST